MQQRKTSARAEAETAAEQEEKMAAEGAYAIQKEEAMRWYSLAAALALSCEATYKLGDMFARGRAVPRDMNKAYRLYERSLTLAHNDAQRAQPAFRIAQVLIDPEGPSYGAEPNPLRALALF